MRSFRRGVAVAALIACGVAGSTFLSTAPAGATTPTTLTNGVPVAGIAGTEGSAQFWELDVPAGQDTLTFAIQGGTGDADLYVRQGDVPTADTYDCRPYLAGNTETCTFPAPLSGAWFVMLRGFTAFSGVSLTGTYQVVPNNDFSIAVDPPSGSTTADSSITATVSTAIVSGAAQNVAFSATNLPPNTTASFSPASVTSGAATTMNLSIGATTPSGVYDITITGTGPGAKIHSTIYELTVVDDPAAPLSSGVPVTAISGAQDSQQVWRIDVPAGTDLLSINSSGGTGDVDLYARRGAVPTPAAYDCRSHTHGNSESCDFVNPGAGRWYVMLQGYASFAGVNLSATTSTFAALTNRVPAKAISGAIGSTQTWKLTVPAAKKKLTFQVSGGSGDAELYVRLGLPATNTTFDCHPVRNGKRAECTFPSPVAGTYYVTLQGVTAFSKVELAGKYA